MSWISDRLQELTADVEAAIAGSDLTDATLVTVSNAGSDFLTSRSQRAGAVIVYPYPRITWPNPKTRRVTWTLGVIATGKAVDAAARCGDLLAVIEASGVVAWRAADATAEPTDFAVSEDPAAPKIPGWAIHITEEHMP